MFLKPSEHIRHDFLSADLVVQLMAHARIQFHAIVGKVPLLHLCVDLAHAIAPVAHRIFFSGDEKHGKCKRQFVIPALIRDKSQKILQIQIAGDGKHETAIGILVVFFNDLLIPCQPVIIRLGIWNMGIVGTEHHLGDKGRTILFSFDLYKLRNNLACAQSRIGAGTAGDHRTVYKLPAKRQIRTRKEGSHTVSVEKYRNPGISFLHLFRQKDLILHHVSPAVLRRKISQILIRGHAVLMADMIISVDKVSLRRKMGDVILIALHMLRHAVDQLDHGLRRPFCRCINKILDVVYPVGA